MEVSLIKVRCHWCWRDPNCECDCQFCDYEPDEAIGDCSCICHTPFKGYCQRCKNTRYISYEPIGTAQKAISQTDMKRLKALSTLVDDYSGEY